MIVIEVPKKLTESEFEHLLRDCLNVINNLDRTIQFNFSKTEFISSFGMIEFVLLCEDIIRRKGKRVSLFLSDSYKISSCMHILARLGFFECLPKQVTYYPYKPKSHKQIIGKNEAILEVTRVLNSAEAYEIVDRVENAILANTTYEKAQVNDICIMVSELLQNIFDHSQSKLGGLIAIQNYTKIRYMQLVIADAGVGIPKTLRNCEEYKFKNLSDVAAIWESVKKGVSRFGKSARRGEGLARCVQIAKKHKAYLYIRSNKGWAKVVFSRGRGQAGHGCLLQGTQIFVNFPSK